MPKKISTKKIQEVKDWFLNYPSMSDRKIAQEVGLDHVSVSKIRKDYEGHYDVEFMKMTAGKFIKTFGEAREYWLSQIDKLEVEKKYLHNLLGEKKVIFKAGVNGQTYPDEVDLDPIDKASIVTRIVLIEKQQSELQSMIMKQANEGQAIKVIQMMRTGELAKLIG